MEKPDLTLVIPTSGRFDSVDRLLRSLFLQDFEIAKVEVIVAMTSFDPAQEERIGRWQGHLNIRGVVAEAPGLNQARNLAARIARGEVILFVDDHFELRQNDILKAHLEYHRDPNLAGLGGNSTIPADASIAMHAFHLAGWSWIENSRNSDGSVSVLLGGHASYKRRVFAEGFRFDESSDARKAGDPALKLRYADEIRPLRHDSSTAKTFLGKAFLEGYHRKSRNHSGGFRDAFHASTFSERTPFWRKSLLKLYYRTYQWGSERGRDHATGAKPLRTSRIARWLELVP